MMASLNKNTFCSVRGVAPFCIETNPRENRFFAASGRLVGKKGTHSVKKRTENCTKQKRKRLFVDEVSGCKPLDAETGIGGEMVDVGFKHRGKDPLCVQAFVRNGYCRCAELPHGGALCFMPNPRLQTEISQRHGEPCNWERCLGYPLQTPKFGKTGVSGAWMMSVRLACGQVAAFIRP